MRRHSAACPSASRFVSFNWGLVTTSSSCHSNISEHRELSITLLKNFWGVRNDTVTVLDWRGDPSQTVRRLSSRHSMKPDVIRTIGFVSRSLPVTRTEEPRETCSEREPFDRQMSHQTRLTGRPFLGTGRRHGFSQGLPDPYNHRLQERTGTDCAIRGAVPDSPVPFRISGRSFGDGGDPVGSPRGRY